MRKLLTTQEAADAIGVSHPYLVRLLDNGDIPCAKTGTHRRVRFDDLMAFKERRDGERRERLREITRMSDEMGLYAPPNASRRVQRTSEPR
jgi:excisionase family DNA binding protein